ncbi:hypothetical protein GC194_02890 [bacterium]|nr:hypothetical protein [bacterium]
MKRIFVPTDFSTCGNNALEMAINLCKEYGAALEVAHGFNANSELISSDFISPFQGVPGTLSPEQINEFVAERVKYIDENLKAVADRVKEEGIEVRTHKVDSALFDLLAATAQELQCDLVVMGTHGSSGIEEALIGSNTQKFVRNSKIPVLVVKDKPGMPVFKNVAFFSTFTQEGERKIYNDFMELFQKQNFVTHLVYVNTPSHFLSSPEAEKRMYEFIENTKPNVFETHIYNYHNVEEGMINYAAENKIDLVVMATHGYSGFRRLMHTSHTESIINHGEFPVLSFWLGKQS